MPRQIQFGARKASASPRRLVLRLFMFDLTNGFFKKLADSFDDPPFQDQSPRAVQTFDLPLADEKQETTGGENLNATAISSLRNLFLLLDDWDRSLSKKKSAENASPKHEVLVDTRTQ
jgi:hypothetical protein